MAKKYTSVIIGHITEDTNVDYQGNQVRMHGGASLCSSASAYGLGHNVLVVTRLKRSDFSWLDEFRIPRGNIIAIESPTSSRMYNRYFTADKERRECRCSEIGTPFTVDDIKDYDAEIYHFAGLVYGDYSDEMIVKASEFGKVALDVQTCLRHVDPADGSMFFEDWASKKKLLPYVDFLKTDAAEAEIMTGTTDRQKAARMLFDMGAKEVLITHNTEVLAFDGKTMLTCPIKARSLAGRTGRGDTTFGAYINERVSSPLPEALLWATATVSLKMETPGPFAGDRKDVSDYIDEFYT